MLAVAQQHKTRSSPPWSSHLGFHRGDFPRVQTMQTSHFCSQRGHVLKFQEISLSKYRFSSRMCTIRAIGCLATLELSLSQASKPTLRIPIDSLLYLPRLFASLSGKSAQALVMRLLFWRRVSSTLKSVELVSALTDDIARLRRRACSARYTNDATMCVKSDHRWLSVSPCIMSMWQN